MAQATPGDWGLCVEINGIIESNKEGFGSLCARGGHL